jgi:MFS family permease
VGEDSALFLAGIIRLLLVAATKLARFGSCQDVMPSIGPERPGFLNTVAIVFGLPVPFLTGYLMDRFGRRWGTVPGFTVYALSGILVSLTAFCSLPVTFFLVTYVLVLATQGTITRLWISVLATYCDNSGPSIMLSAPSKIIGGANSRKVTMKLRSQMARVVGGRIGRGRSI